MKNVVALFFLLVFSACRNENQTSEKNQTILTSKIKYAKEFSLSYYKDYKILTLNNAWVGGSNSYKYVLYKYMKPNEGEDAIYIKTPIKNIACMSLTHVAFIEKLNHEKSIVALSGSDFVSSPVINDKIKKGFIKEIGNTQSINYEMLIEKSPDIIMGFGIDGTSNNFINKMESLGLLIVLNAEYMETHPLGKAEWIKFIAAFYDEDEKADSIFNSIESTYLSLLELTKNIEDKPTVFTGMPWNGSWYVPGAESFQAKLFIDAGAEYLWMDNNEKSSMVKSKEIIIDKAFEAEYWLNQDSYKSIEEIIGYDKKFRNFESVKKAPAWR